MPHKVRLKGCAEELASGVGLGESESLPGFSRRRRPSLRTPGQRRGPRPGRGLCSSRRASERARAANAPGRDPAARMTARGAAGRCPPTTWLCPWLLLFCLLVSRTITEEASENCSHLIGNGHLRFLQELIDSQMESLCEISFRFVDPDQLKDPVCYLKKAFPLVQDIMEDTMRFKDNTHNANVTMQLQELSLRLKSCFTKDYEEQDKACIRTFKETPLQLLAKIKNVFNEIKNLLKNDWNIFSKNCSNDYANCPSPGHETKHVGPADPQLPGFVFRLLVPSIILVLLAVGGLLFYRRRRRSHQELQTVDVPMEQLEDSPLTQDEDRQVELPV
ncbi:macrophage colony-stimulating factor 1 isoform X7 [Equus quagga]|uniref:macrophage colony-stimulating factor 1 isoform X7 n=1 Tax=Equus quagga TaxID=89248 RepID=UPI001EE1CE8E|nr:macrophage colony-stimulating factor 1 isoform X7 [Equus quagga]